MPKEKILLISWTLFPATSGSSVIVNNIASQFSKDEMVMVGEAVPGKNTRTWDSSYPDIHYVNPNISIRGRGQTWFRWANANKVISQVTKIAKDEGCTKILTIFPDDFYLNVGYQVSKKLGLPLYTWFHNTYLDNYEGLRKSFAKRFQPEIFDYAKITYVMSDGMLKYYQKQYPNTEFKTLVHGFPIPNVTFQPYEAPKKRVKFLFTGSLNESCRDATVRLMKLILENPNYELHMYTGNPMSHFEKYGIGGENVHHHGFIALEDLVKAFEQYDVMLLPHGFDGIRTDVEYKTIFPTRTIPCLYSNKPILAHSPKDVFLTNFLNENKCALNVDTKDTKVLQEAIDKITTDTAFSNELIKNAIKTSRIFDLERVAGVIKSDILGAA